jgi:hypothetical protein
MSEINCEGSFFEGTACGECERCLEESGNLMILNYGPYAERQYGIRNAIQSCPLCGSNQVQICLDYNNPVKDTAKCRECKCQAPLTAWNERKPVNDKEL